MKASIAEITSHGSPCEHSSTSYQTLESHFFHSHMALVKYKMVLITLPVHIFLTLQLEGKLA